MKDNIIDSLYEIDQIWFFIGTLISADYLTNRTFCVSALDTIHQMMKDLETSKLKDDLNLRQKLKDAEEIVSRELKIFTDIDESNYDVVIKAREFSFNYPSEVFHQIDNPELKKRLILEFEDAYRIGYIDGRKDKK